MLPQGIQQTVYQDHRTIQLPPVSGLFQHGQTLHRQGAGVQVIVVMNSQGQFHRIVGHTRCGTGFEHIQLSLGPRKFVLKKDKRAFRYLA